MKHIRKNFLKSFSKISVTEFCFTKTVSLKTRTSLKEVVFFGFFPENYSPMFKSSRPEVFLGKCVLKICSKFTREHPC